jgi:hypothetical protein
VFRTEGTEIVSTKTLHSTGNLPGCVDKSDSPTIKLHDGWWPNGVCPTICVYQECLVHSDIEIA